MLGYLCWSHQEEEVFVYMKTKLLSVLLTLMLVLSCSFFFAGTTRAASASISASGITYPAHLYFGTGFVVKGRISSGVRLTEVKVGVMTTAGKWKTGYYKRVSPKTTSYDLNRLDSAVPISKLASGTYYYTVYAKNSGGRTATLLKKQFTVSYIGTSGASKPTTLKKGSGFVIQAGAVLGDAAYLIVADAQRSPSGDVGWRWAYDLLELYYLRVPLDTGRPETLTGPRWTGLSAAEPVEEIDYSEVAGSWRLGFVNENGDGVYSYYPNEEGTLSIDYWSGYADFAVGGYQQDFSQCEIQTYIDEEQIERTAYLFSDPSTEDTLFL